MSKAILVVDIEKCCVDCQCSWIDDKGMVICLALRGEEVGKDGIKPDWCPLKEIPNYMVHDPNLPVTKTVSFDYVNGFNDCINKILK